MIYIDAHDCPCNSYRMILLKHSEVYYQVITDQWHEDYGHLFWSGQRLRETRCGQCQTPILLISHDETYTRFDALKIPWDELLADPAAVFLEVLL